jgi:transposase-like protein
MSKTQEQCLALLEQIRWGGKPRCPYCQSIRSALIKQERRYHCNECFTSYSVTVGTLFHHTHVKLSKWFQAVVLVNNSSPLSIRQLATAIGVNKNTASSMLERIHKAANEEPELISQLLKAIEEFKY